MPCIHPQSTRKHFTKSKSHQISKLTSSKILPILSKVLTNTISLSSRMVLFLSSLPFPTPTTNRNISLLERFTALLRRISQKNSILLLPKILSQILKQSHWMRKTLFCYKIIRFTTLHCSSIILKRTQLTSNSTNKRLNGQAKPY